MEANPTKSKLVEGAYCRVWGKLKSFHERRHVTASIIRPIEDMNEVSYHLLEATAVHLHYTRGPLGQSNDAGGAGQAQNTNGATGQADGRAAELASYSKVAQQVYKFLEQTKQGDQGIHQQVIASQLGLNTADVARAGDQLLEGGLIYTTVDDVTWALLEAE